MAQPVIIVTGANGGVGYGICQRLLGQLCLPHPPDAQPQSWASNNVEPTLAGPPFDGLTLIMACRSTKRGETARQQLLDELDASIASLRSKPKYDGRAEAFRRNVTIEIEQVDLADLRTVFAFVQRVSKRHAYISHLIFNAGMASFKAIDWIGCVKQLCTDFIGAVTRPSFYTQHVGEVSVDGYGLVWQSNLFGHYVMFRGLEPLLQSASYPAASRVIWSSSLEASPLFYNPADWQLVKTDRSYKSVKYQIDLISTLFDYRALATSPPPKQVRHFVTQPGVAATNISEALVATGSLLDRLKFFFFFLGRFGTRHLPITALNAAIAVVHVTLVSLSFITFTDEPVRFGAETDCWGNPEVGLTPVAAWEEHKTLAESLVETFDQVYRTESIKHQPS